MNIIKGIDRIGLVCAFIVIFPGFSAGWEFTQNKFETVSPKYIAWEQRSEEKRKKLVEKYKRLSGIERNQIIKEKEKQLLLNENTLLLTQALLASDPPSVEKFVILHTEDMRQAKPVRYLDPPYWKKIAGGLIFALVSFFFVLFGIRGSSRGIKNLSLWIIEGFKGA